MLLLGLFSFIIANLVFLWYFKYFKFNQYIFKYNGPTPLPIFGNLLMIRSAEDSIPTLSECCKQYGTVFQFWLGYRPRLVICDYKMAEFVLASRTILEKGPEYKLLSPWLGTGLLTSSGSKWHAHRKLITPAFHFQILEKYIAIFNAQSNILVDTFLTKAESEPFDIFPFINLCTLDIICEAAMGTRVNAQKQTDSKYVNSVKEMCAVLSRRVLSPIKIVDSLFRFTKDYHVQNECLAVLHDYTNSVIRSRQKEILETSNKETKMHDKDVGIKNRMAFLDLLLQSRLDGKLLDNEDIRQEVDTFMFEGHDTTTAGISFTLYCLSKHQDCQKKVVEELLGIFGSSATIPPTYKDFQEMKYLEMVIKESMRLYPPVPIFARTVTEDTEYDGSILPKGLTLIIPTFLIHLQEVEYPNPTKFDPERFSLENSTDRSPFSYLAFSAGARNCIGQRFAMLEMKSTISTILRNFQILPAIDHQVKVVAQTILRPTNGLLVRLQRINSHI